MLRHTMVTIAGLLLVVALLGRPLVGAALLNLSSIHVGRWMLGDDLAGSEAGVFLTHSQRWAQLPPRQVGRVSRFQALADDPLAAIPLRPVELHEWLQTARQQQDTEQAKALEQQLVGLQPQYSLDAPTPIEAPSGWTILGYDLNRPMLGPLPTVRIALYWEHDGAPLRSPGATRIGDWEWVWAGRRVYQIGHVKNLAPNGGFEGQLDLEDGYTPGWSYLENCIVPPALAILRRYPAGTSVVLSLTSQSGACRLYSSYRIPLLTSGSHLMSAWIMVKGESDSKACVGNTWWGSIKTAFCASESRWVHQARVVLPRPEDDAVSLYVEVDGQGTRAFFDDILFFPLDLQPLSQLENELRVHD